MSIMIGIITIIEPYPTAYAGKDSTKELCKENGGEWDSKKEICKIEDDEERAAYENYVWDDPDNSRYPKICKPWLFED